MTDADRLAEYMAGFAAGVARKLRAHAGQTSVDDWCRGVEAGERAFDAAERAERERLTPDEPPADCRCDNGIVCSACETRHGTGRRA